MEQVSKGKNNNESACHKHSDLNQYFNNDGNEMCKRFKDPHEMVELKPHEKTT